MATKDKTICVGCRNTYEEIRRLYGGNIGWLSADASVAMRSAVRKAGIAPQKNGRKLKFYEVDAAKAEHLNADGRTVVAAMSDIFYDPVVTIEPDAVNTIINDTCRRYCKYDEMDYETFEAFKEELIDKLYEALRLVPEDDYLNRP